MPAGRPTDYDPDILPKLPLLVDSGATDTEVADALGVSVRTVYRWKNEHPEFRQALKLTKDQADERVETSLFRRATGYEIDAVKIFCGKGGRVTKVPYQEHVPPDTTAMIFWLKNRRPAEWRDKIEQEITGDAKFLPITYIQALNIALGYDPNAKLKTEKIAETATEKTVDVSAFLPD